MNIPIEIFVDGMNRPDCVVDASAAPTYSLGRERKYRNRENSVIIEAVQYDGSNKSEIENFVGRKLDYYVSEFKAYPAAPPRRYLLIPYFYTNMYAANDDYIIKNIGNKFCVCSPNIFEKNYELVI